MKGLIVLALVAAAYANVVPTGPDYTALGFIENYAIPLGEKIRKAEEQKIRERIIGGSPSALGQIPYQAGLLGSFININGTGVCGGSLVSANRVITAAHCWYDGVNQAWRFTVVLGSVTLFSGGTRIDTSVVAMHPNWSPSLIRNDVAVIYQFVYEMQIGITSFGIAFGCEIGWPAVFARVTSFLPFFDQHI